MAPHITYPYTGRLIIRLTKKAVENLLLLLYPPGTLPHSTQTLDYRNLIQVAERLGLTELHDLLEQFTQIKAFPLLTERPLEMVMALEETASHSPFPPLHSLISYYVLDPRTGLNEHQIEYVLQHLQHLPEGVDRVYLEPELRDAVGWAVNPNDPRAVNQDYLLGGLTGADRFKGIDVRNAAVWGSYDGTGIGFVDLESAWNLDHEDLPVAAFPLYNTNRNSPTDPNSNDHGTAVLGVVVGVDNSKGILGIAPGASLRRVVSRIKSAADEWDIVGAVMAALDAGVMTPGDVLLVEVETILGNPINGYPIEIFDPWFDAIRLAVGNGMIVVEAAGNGAFDADGNDIARDLDRLTADWPSAPTWRSLNRADAKFVDSGAIVVSACASTVAPSQAHRRLSYASLGSRVDCYAWGENVYTAGDGTAAGDPTDPNTWYRNDFRGTSSASAIVAGAAILVQQMHLVTHGWRLAPAQVRALLADQTLGTKIVDTTDTKQIGVMPDIARIAMKLGVVPDVFIRDSVADAGVVPNTMVFQSPDIIVRSTVSPDPVAEYGEASPLANAVPLIDPVQPNQPNYIYIRMRNRGMNSALGTTVQVYWSEASSLVVPANWNLIGTAGPVDVPAGGVLTVAGPLVWTPKSGNYPASGHGCFVAASTHPLDPQPPIVPAKVTWDEFLTYVGRNNNVAWRNFSVIEPTPSGSGWWAQAAFFIRGAGDRERIFELEILQRVQKGVRIWWEIPTALAELMRRGSLDDLEQYEETDDGVRLPLWTRRARRIPRLSLAGEANYPCRLEFTLPRDIEPGLNQVALRQIFEGVEVGRVTWVIGTPRLE